MLAHEWVRVSLLGGLVLIWILASVWETRRGRQRLSPSSESERIRGEQRTL